MRVESHPIVHQDFRLWLNDLVRWQQELSGWQQELSSVRTDLDRAMLALADHRRALESHGEQLAGEKAFLSEYQAAMTGCEAGEPLSGLVPPVGAIAEWVERHPHLWDVHERIKRHHHRIVETAALLLKAMAEPM